MKIDRLIGIITILLQEGRATAPELARRFEVSRRTINRDIETLCKAGIPVVAVQGYGGGFSLSDGYKWDQSFFTRDELQAVLAGLKGMDSVSQSSVFAGLADKLAGKDRPAEEEIILIDLASHYQEPLKQKIEEITAAIRSRHLLEFRYCYEKGEGKRRIEPYRLVFKWSSWYVFGFCLDRQAYRLFKLNRLWDLRAEDGTFRAREIPPEELDFGDYLAEGGIHLTAVFDAGEKYRLIDEYGTDSYRVLEDGRLWFERDFASYANLRAWVFGFGDKVSVLAPQRLRDERIAQAENILRAEQEQSGKERAAWQA